MRSVAGSAEHMCWSRLCCFSSQSERKSCAAVCAAEFLDVSRAAAMTRQKCFGAPSKPWRTAPKKCSVLQVSLPRLSRTSSLSISISPCTSASAPRADMSARGLRTLKADLHWMMRLQKPVTTSYSLCTMFTGVVSKSVFIIELGSSGLFNSLTSNKCWHRGRSEKETSVYPEKVSRKVWFVSCSCFSMIFLNAELLWNLEKMCSQYRAQWNALDRVCLSQRFTASLCATTASISTVLARFFSTASMWRSQHSEFSLQQGFGHPLRRKVTT